MSEEAAKEMMLSALRDASYRSRAWDQVFIKIGTALKDGRISPDFAISWLRELGGIDWLDPTTIMLVAKENTPIGIETGRKVVNSHK